MTSQILYYVISISLGWILGLTLLWWCAKPETPKKARVSRGESLDRYYLLRAFGFGVFLHRIHNSDPVGLFHNHPWNGFSIIFGHYFEYTRETCKLRRGLNLRRGFNFIKATQHHRVVVSKPVWTLFFHGRKCNKWSVIDQAGGEVSVPWDGPAGLKSYSAAANNPQPLTP